MHITPKTALNYSNIPLILSQISRSNTPDRENKHQEQRAKITALYGHALPGINARPRALIPVNKTEEKDAGLPILTSCIA